MRWSDRFALGFVPLMARVFLCLAFLPVGWQKVFTLTAFSAADTARLNQLGVGDAGLDWPRVKSTGVGDAGAEAPPAARSAQGLKARSLYVDALTCERARIPYPAVAAWGIALVELGGAVLLLLGLFARFAALGIAIVMGGALWFTSLPVLRETSWWTLPADVHATLWASAALFALAITVALAGAGWLTLDHAMAGGGTRTKGRVGADVDDSKAK